MTAAAHILPTTAVLPNALAAGPQPAGAEDAFAAMMAMFTPSQAVAAAAQHSADGELQLAATLPLTIVTPTKGRDQRATPPVQNARPHAPSTDEEAPKAASPVDPPVTAIGQAMTPPIMIQPVDEEPAPVDRDGARAVPEALPNLQSMRPITPPKVGGAVGTSPLHGKPAAEVGGKTLPGEVLPIGAEHVPVDRDPAPVSATVQNLPPILRPPSSKLDTPVLSVRPSSHGPVGGMALPAEVLPPTDTTAPIEQAPQAAAASAPSPATPVLAAATALPASRDSSTTAPAARLDNQFVQSSVAAPAPPQTSTVLASTVAQPPQGAAAPPAPSISAADMLAVLQFTATTTPPMSATGASVAVADVEPAQTAEPTHTVASGALARPQTAAAPAPPPPPVSNTLVRAITQVASPPATIEAAMPAPATASPSSSAPAPAYTGSALSAPTASDAPVRAAPESAQPILTASAPPPPPAQTAPAPSTTAQTLPTAPAPVSSAPRPDAPQVLANPSTGQAAGPPVRAPAMATTAAPALEIAAAVMAAAPASASVVAAPPLVQLASAPIQATPSAQLPSAPSLAPVAASVASATVERASPIAAARKAGEVATAANAAGRPALTSAPLAATALSDPPITAKMSMTSPAAGATVAGTTPDGTEEAPVDGSGPSARADAAGPPPAQAAAQSQASAGAPVRDATVVRGAPETVAHLSAEIGRKLEARTTRFQVELRPAGLGRVGVDVQIAASGQITAALNFDSPHSAELMRSHAHDLQAQLEQAGFSLAGGSLSFTSGGGGQASDDGGSAPRSFATAASARSAQLTSDQPTTTAAYAARTAEGRVDVRI